MKKINVVAAVIQKDGLILATQRGYGEFRGGWEFPGGKIENGETPEAALEREILEELSITITIKSFITTVEYDYSDFHLTMRCYLCEIKDGEILLLEHEAARWLRTGMLESVEWLPADKVVVSDMKNKISRRKHI